VRWQARCDARRRLLRGHAALGAQLYGEASVRSEKASEGADDAGPGQMFVRCGLLRRMSKRGAGAPSAAAVL
jgi:hypothetical protein